MEPDEEFQVAMLQLELMTQQELIAEILKLSVAFAEIVNILRRFGMKVEAGSGSN